MNNFNDIDYDKVINIIVEEIDPESIILFGSRGRGTNEPDSDLDLLVVDRGNFSKERSRHSVRNRLRQALSEIRVSKDILLYNNSEVEHWKDYCNHIIHTCVSEGKVLYAKP